MLLMKKPNNRHKNDKSGRLWQGWYYYSTCMKTEEIIYGDMILIRPNINPESKKFIQW